MTKDYYQILGIERDADIQTIKKAYRNLARKHHPDVDKSPGAEERFKEINEAYQVLSDPQKRTTYDQFGSAAFDANAFSQAYSQWKEGPGGYSFRTFSWGPRDFSFDFDFSGFADPFDIFEIVFGSRSPFGQEARLPRYILSLEFQEAVKGVEKEVEVQGKRTKVRVPAGVDDSSEIKFKNFILVCQVKPHEKFKRRGYDLFTDEKIHFTQAALGDEIQVETIDGPVKIRIPQGTKPQTQIRLRGKGVSHMRDVGRGDQYVRVIVDIPEKYNQEEKKLLQKLLAIRKK